MKIRQFTLTIHLADLFSFPFLRNYSKWCQNNATPAGDVVDNNIIKNQTRKMADVIGDRSDIFNYHFVYTGCIQTKFMANSLQHWNEHLPLESATVIIM